MQLATNLRTQTWYEKIILYVTDMVNFMVDHLNSTVGNILIKASPILAPLPSAIFVYYALRAADFAFWPSLTIVGVVESLGFAAVYAKHRIDAVNRSLPIRDQKDTKIADRMIHMYIGVTLAVLFAFESVPAWAVGDMVHGLVHSAPLLFPFFSLLGANIYSLLDWIERAETASEQNRTNELNAIRTEFEREMERIRGEYDSRIERLDDRIERLQSENAVLNGENERLRSENTNVHSELANVREHAAELRGVVRSTERTSRTERRSNVRTNDPRLDRGSNERKTELMDRLHSFYLENPAAPLSQASQVVGRAASTISGYLHEMKEAGRMEKRDDKWYAVPEAALYRNGAAWG